MFVIGTAGHVDHGKSALVHALTGIDPDRLQEEKDRGMTIDLGFAWLKLPGGEEVSIVDVPGHEHFIKNMLAGVGGIDLAMLVVAADEGVMPQTREHLAILDLLGVKRGILVITKSDLADAEWLDLVAAEVEELASTTCLAGAPLVRCSATTKEGLGDLLRTIEDALSLTQAKRDLSRPRLPIDRVFTVSGFGTVVTGTLIDGTFHAGQDVEVLPASVGGKLTNLQGRVRGLQTHRSKVDTAQPGTRTAVNLGGLDPEQLHRGQVVTTPGWLTPTTAVDVRLRALGSLGRALRHNLNVSFHSLASDAMAQLRLLEADTLKPGDEAWAQLRLREPLALVNGDRFIIRDSNETLGGGVIVDSHARRHIRKRPTLLEDLERRLSGDPADLLFAAILAAEPCEPATAVKNTELSPSAAAEALVALIEAGRVVALGAERGRIVYTAGRFEAVRAQMAEAITSFLKEHPLRPGVPKEELRSRLGVTPRVFTMLLDAAVASGELLDRGAGVSTADWQPELTPAQRAKADAYLAAVRAEPYSPAPDLSIEPELLAFLEEEGVVENAGGVVFDAAAFRAMVVKVTELLQREETVTLAQVRDLLGTSRRYVQALLERMDNDRITVRRGDKRVLRSSGGPTA
jgi:selenocysteine-specific elongation factor